MIALPAPLRYGVVSGICFVLGAGLVPLIASLGVHYAAAAVITFAIVAVTGFLLHVSWTFDAEPSLRGFLRYVMAMAFNLPASVILIGLGHDGLGLSVALSSLASSLILTAWNFVAVRWAVRSR